MKLVWSEKWRFYAEEAAEGPERRGYKEMGGSLR